MTPARPARPPWVGALLLGVLAASAACGGAEVVPAAAPSAEVSPTPEPSVSAEPVCVPAPLERRAAAVLVVGLPDVTTAEDPLVAAVTDVGVGGVFLAGGNVESAEQVTALVDGLRGRSEGPLLVSTDEESGRVAVMRDVVGSGPSPRRLARQETPEDVRAYAAGIGEQLAAVGIDLDLAPVLDLDGGAWDGVIGDRSFSDDPTVASQYGLAFSLGLHDAGVTPTVKHFPGHGRAGTDPHTGSAQVDASLDELRATDLVPFQDAVDAGVPVVMLGHPTYTAIDPDRPVSLSPAGYELLRSTGFEGVAITDSLGMGAVNQRWPFPEAAVMAIEAGADAALATDGTQAAAMRDALVEAVRSGRLPEERLSLAAARVTALAGGDPQLMSCLDVDLPEPADP